MRLIVFFKTEVSDSFVQGLRLEKISECFTVNSAPLTSRHGTTLISIALSDIKKKELFIATNMTFAPEQLHLPMVVKDRCYWTGNKFL